MSKNKTFSAILPGKKNKSKYLLSNQISPLTDIFFIL